MRRLDEPEFRMAAETRELGERGLRVVRILHGWKGIEDGEKPDCLQELSNPVPWRLYKDGQRHFCTCHVGSIDADLIEDEEAWMRAAKIVLEDSKTDRGALVRAWMWKIVRFLGFPIWGKIVSETKTTTYINKKKYPDEKTLQERVKFFEGMGHEVVVFDPDEEEGEEAEI